MLTRLPLLFFPVRFCALPQFPEIIKAGPAARRVFALVDRQPAIDTARVGLRAAAARDGPTEAAAVASQAGSVAPSCVH